MESLPTGLVEAMAAPAAYPVDASARRGVTQVQTHISQVFLTGERVYKLRKAVRLGFLDFSTRVARNADALRELRLNRRLAPDVYLGLVPVLPHGAGWRVGALGEELRDDAEHALVMRRLAEGRDALSLLAAGALTRNMIRAAAERIAGFHVRQRLGTPAPFSAAAWREGIDRPMQDNLASLQEHAVAAGLAATEIEALASAWSQALVAHAPALEARRMAGHAVDGHGDLHLAHLWFETAAAPPLIIDCVEFDAKLRRIDAASDAAFLFMDLLYRDAAAPAEHWLSDYASASGDFGLYDVVDLHAAYRAAVRAKVAALAAADPEIATAQRRAAAESAGRHLAFSHALLEARPCAALVLVAGTVGVGKSSVAAALAETAGAVLLSSDRTRKALAGLSAQDHAGAATLYAPDWNARTYATLLEHAAPALRSGRIVVLDATWSLRVQRRAANDLAAALGAPAWLVRVDCSESLACQRVAIRAQRGDDPSDAGTERVAPSRAGFEPLDDWPDARLLELSTDEPGWQRQIPKLLETIRSATPSAARSRTQGS